MQTIPSDIDKVTINLTNTDQQEVTFRIYFDDDIDPIMAPFSLESGETKELLFEMSAPPKVGYLEKKVINIAGTPVEGIKSIKAVTFEIISVEGKELGATCDRDEECLSGNCFAYLQDDMKCRSTTELPSESTKDDSPGNGWIIGSIAVVIVIFGLVINWRSSR